MTDDGCRIPDAFDRSPQERPEKQALFPKTAENSQIQGPRSVYTPLYTPIYPWVHPPGSRARTRVPLPLPASCSKDPYRQEDSRKTDFSGSIGEVDRLTPGKLKLLITLLSAIQYSNQVVLAWPCRGVLEQ